MAREGAEVHPLNITPQSSPFIRRRFDQITPTTTESHPWQHKRMKKLSDGSAPDMLNPRPRERGLPDLIDYSDSISVRNLKEELDCSMYGSVTKDIEDLRAQKYQMMNSLLAVYPSLSSRPNFSPQSPTSGLHTNDSLNGQSIEGAQMRNRQISSLASREIIDLDDDCIIIDSPAVQYSKLICKSFTDIQGHGCKDTKASHGSVWCREMPKLENDLQNHNNKKIPIIDSDEEESVESIGPMQASRCSQEAVNFEIPQPSQSQEDLDRGNSPTTHLGTTYQEVHGDEHDNNKVILAQPSQSQEDLDRGNSSTTHLGTTYQEVHGDEHDNNKVILALPVPRTALNASRIDSFHYQEAVLKKPIDETPIKGFAGINGRGSEVVTDELKTSNAETELKKDKGVYVGVQDDVSSHNINFQFNSDEGLGDIWREMTVALECNKEAITDIVEHTEDVEGEECDHSFLLKDDLGYVCRVCGLVRKSIEEIFEYQWGKASRSTRTYMRESRGSKDIEENGVASFSNGSHDVVGADICVHPRHMKQMKPHQLEGFNFLVRNLMCDDPGGCILAHAPGSGKTFMIISFIQSFLAKFPNARPLVVLPKGILGTWKKEFVRWQVEDIPLYDFYSSKAESRMEQLELLEEWVKHKGIMFLGYQQFANIVSKSETDASASCQDILLKAPTILIMDEGHTPRNQDTDILHSLEKVRTPRKVVLSGTLYQNHVREVFNILNLVRPKFLKSDTSKAIKRRVMGRAQIGRKHIKGGGDAAFFDVVEETLQNDENSKTKVAIIQDLREMTRHVLHYYKGDSLDELPGLVDLTVLVNLSPKQREIVKELKKMETFKRASVGSAVYVHPQLKDFSDGNKLSELINKMDYRDGVKTKFFVDVLGLCESSGEKLLVFSQYLLPLKFLESLVVKLKGWTARKEIFTINGDTSTEDREWCMERFNTSCDAKVLFGSIKACGEGISLVGASRVLIMDVHLNPSVTRQAIGRAFRPGQVRKVYVYRLVACDSPEEENYNTSCRKDLVSKMWFEWSGYYGDSNFEMETVDVSDYDDNFWDSPSLRENVNVVKKR